MHDYDYGYPFVLELSYDYLEKALLTPLRQPPHRRTGKLSSGSTNLDIDKLVTRLDEVELSTDSDKPVYTAKWRTLSGTIGGKRRGYAQLTGPIKVDLRTRGDQKDMVIEADPDAEHELVLTEDDGKIGHALKIPGKSLNLIGNSVRMQIPHVEFQHATFVKLDVAWKKADVQVLKSGIAAGIGLAPLPAGARPAPAEDDAEFNNYKSHLQAREDFGLLFDRYFIECWIHKLAKDYSKKVKDLKSFTLSVDHMDGPSRIDVSGGGVYRFASDIPLKAKGTGRCVYYNMHLLLELVSFHLEAKILGAWLPAGWLFPSPLGTGVGMFSHYAIGKDSLPIGMLEAARLSGSGNSAVESGTGSAKGAANARIQASPRVLRVRKVAADKLTIHHGVGTSSMDPVPLRIYELRSDSANLELPKLSKPIDLLEGESHEFEIRYKGSGHDETEIEVINNAKRLVVPVLAYDREARTRVSRNHVLVEAMYRDYTMAGGTSGARPGTASFLLITLDDRPVTATLAFEKHVPELSVARNKIVLRAGAPPEPIVVRYDPGKRTPDDLPVLGTLIVRTKLDTHRVAVEGRVRVARGHVMEPALEKLFTARVAAELRGWKMGSTDIDELFPQPKPKPEPPSGGAGPCPPGPWLLARAHGQERIDSVTVQTDGELAFERDAEVPGNLLFAAPLAGASAIEIDADASAQAEKLGVELECWQVTDRHALPAAETEGMVGAGWSDDFLFACSPDRIQRFRVLESCRALVEGEPLTPPMELLRARSAGGVTALQGHDGVLLVEGDLEGRLEDAPTMEMSGERLALTRLMDGTMIVADGERLRAVRVTDRAEVIAEAADAAASRVLIGGLDSLVTLGDGGVAFYRLTGGALELMNQVHDVPMVDAMILGSLVLGERADGGSSVIDLDAESVTVAGATQAASDPQALADFRLRGPGDLWVAGRAGAPAIVYRLRAAEVSEKALEYFARAGF